MKLLPVLLLSILPLQNTLASPECEAGLDRITAMTEEIDLLTEMLKEKNISLKRRDIEIRDLEDEIDSDIEWCEEQGTMCGRIQSKIDDYNDEVAFFNRSLERSREMKREYRELFDERIQAFEKIRNDCT